MVSFLALDFGGKKISAAVLIDGCAVPIDLENGSQMPSAIYINNGVVLFGNNAIRVGRTDPSNLYLNLKSLVGKQFNDTDFSRLAHQVPYTVNRDENGRCILMVRENSKRVPKTPTQLITMMINHVLDIVKKKGHSVDGIVFSYPSSFTEPQIREMFAAVAMTGVEHVDMVAETTAACLFSGISPYLNDCYVLVIDCGGGRTDFSVIRVHDKAFTVQFTKGLPDLGGENFTNALQEKVTKELKEWGVDVSSFSEREQREFHEKIEAIKVSFSDNAVTKELTFPGDRVTTPYCISEAAVKIACHKLLKRCEATLQEVLEEVKKRNQTITHVVLSGGGMRLRCLSEKIRGMLRVENTMMNSADAVVCGTAYAAKRMKALHEPGDMCLVYALCSQIDEPIAINSRSTMPSYHESPSVEQEEPTEESQETTLWLTQHPILSPTRPNERDLNSSSFTIEEKRAYNIYLKNSNGFTKVLDKEEALPYESKPYKLGVNSTNIRVTLYEGLSSRIEDCRAIRQIVLECDDYHKQIIEEKRKSGEKRGLPRMLLTITARSNGLLSVKTQWKDTETALKVLEDKPVPPNYRESSHKFDTVSEEGRTTETKSSVSKRVSEEGRETSPQSTETHFNPPLFDSFSLQDSVPFPVICERNETDDPVPIVSSMSIPVQSPKKSESAVPVQSPKKSESAAPPSAKMGSGCTIF